jgi:hypothetical protein
MDAISVGCGSVCLVVPIVVPFERNASAIHAGAFASLQRSGSLRTTRVMVLIAPRFTLLGEASPTRARRRESLYHLEVVKAASRAITDRSKLALPVELNHSTG